MKLYKILICGAVLMTTLHSCRENDEYQPSFVQDEALTISNFSSFEEEFTSLWQAVNTNYAAWDIETVDWDGVLEKYRPQFVELDTIAARGGMVDDDKLQDLYTEILDTLHDGHCNYAIKNLSTGTYFPVYPQQDRNMRRFGEDYQINLECDYDYYASNLVPESERIIDIQEVDMSCKSVLYPNFMLGLVNLKNAWSQAETEEEQEKLMAVITRLQNIINVYPTITLAQEDQLVTIYNQIASQNPEAQMPPYATSITGDNRMNMISFVTNDGIAYLRITNFFLSQWFDKTEDDLEQLVAEGYESDAKFYTELLKVWNYWFCSIQDLKAAGKLKGVIIDVRNNSGGNVADIPYVMGALLPSGGFNVGTYKVKNGTGRLDYSADLSLVLQTRSEEHAVIDEEPIVVLANHQSVSCSETTSVMAKLMPNAVVIGKQTHGGFGMLLPKNVYVGYYAGTFGEQGKTAIYGLQPVMLAKYTGIGVLEGIGVTPDYDVDYKLTPVTDSEGNTFVRDSQFEAALNYIRTK